MVDYSHIESGKYYYKLNEKFSTVIDLPDFYEEWAHCVDNVLTVEKGYEWNGNTPKATIFDIVIGTPEGRGDITKEATLVHDVLYQYGKKNNITRLFSDLEYLKRCRSFKLRYVYYVVLRVFGWIRY